MATEDEGQDLERLYVECNREIDALRNASRIRKQLSVASRLLKEIAEAIQDQDQADKERGGAISSTPYF